MKIVEKMALDCGLKIGKPHIDMSYLPAKEEKYILIDTRTKYLCGGYDHYDDVVQLVKPFLDKENISIFQIATNNDKQIGAKRCFVKIYKRQENYLIWQSKLLVANDNYSLYVASGAGTKSVGLYSVFSPENTRPVWNTHLQTVLESSREGNLPSYGRQNEIPKTINLISPYKVAGAILDNFNIKHDFNTYDLVYIGDNYQNKILEIVPDFVAEPSYLAGQTVNLRFDCVKNMSLAAFQYWMSNKKSNIITDKDVSPQLLAQYKDNIISLSVVVSDNVSEEFLIACKSIGLNIKLFCNKKDEIAKFRFKFFDWTILSEYNEEGKLKELDKITKDSCFVSSKILISKGKKYSCKANFLREITLDDKEERVILNEEFENELAYFKIYNRTE